LTGFSYLLSAETTDFLFSGLFNFVNERIFEAQLISKTVVDAAVQVVRMNRHRLAILVCITKFDPSSND